MQPSNNALETLEKRYFLRDEQGEVVENWEQFLDRVSGHVASVEKTEEERKLWAKQFRQLMADLDFFPNTPTLMNAGKEKGQLSACFVLPVEDSIDGIFTTLKNAAKIHQTGGGTGFDFSRLRPEGSMVSSKAGVSTGPLSFCQVFDKGTEVIKQGATRRGANMMNLRVDHPDIEGFIDMKMQDGVMENFNVSVTVTNEFMEAYKDDKQYALKHKETGFVKALSAVDVLDKIAHNAWKSAEPGLVFIDRINEKSPYEEPIEATNPCGEQPLPPFGACNLGSINLSNFVVDGDMDWLRLSEVVRVATRFLDNVIDANHWPIPEIERHAQKYRNIGLGPMGWADALIKLKIPYNSEEAVDKAEEVGKFINKTAHEYSEELAWKKGPAAGGPFPTFFDYSSPNRRNATLTNAAPTGSICILATCSSGIEPNFAFALEKHVMDTVLTEYHPLLEAAKNNGGVNKEVFVEAHNVDPIWHVDMQAAWQKHIDAAISKTINLPEEVTEEDVKRAYLRAWETGCKGITVYRDGSRYGVLHRKTIDEVVGETEPRRCECGGEIIFESGCESCKSCGASKCLIA